MSFHFVGIGGIGMSALASVLLDRKADVSGTDQRASRRLQRLESSGARVKVGSDTEMVNAGTTLIYSSAIPKDHPELEKGRELGCELLHRAELLGELMRGYQPIVVAGAHGKTTVTCLLSWVLMRSGWDPAFAAGGMIAGLQINGSHGRGDYFIAEGDESDGSYLNYHPFGAVVTNVEADHLDYHGSIEALQESYRQFLSQVASADHLVWCGDDPWLKGENPPGVSYGLSEACHFSAKAVEQRGFKLHFQLLVRGEPRGEIEAPLLGESGLQNALAVIAMGQALGVSLDQLKQGLATFPGIHRRSEIKGEPNGVLVIDDYAHHPTEVRATLQGVRQAIGSRRLVAIFQPHRYSRLQEHMNSFGEVLQLADRVVVTDVDGAGESAIPGVNGRLLADQIDADHIAREQLVARLRAELRAGDVALVLGAGDVTEVAEEIASKFKLRVAVLFGGPSKEHKISVQSARWVIDALDRSRYDVELFGINRQGGWLVGERVMDKLDTHCAPFSLDPQLIAKLQQCDVAIPVFHGDKGEDGLLPAFLEFLGIPFVGFDYRASSISMDKVFTKQVAQSLGIPTAAFIALWREEWQRNGMQRLLKELSLPLFVKPAHLGSTVGVERVETKSALNAALGRVFALDERAVVEEEICGREMELCILGNRAHPEVAYPAEILKPGQVHTYATKYGTDACPIDCQPELSADLVERAQEIARNMFVAVGGHGLARIDCFLDRQGKWWFNEINPFPGCTPTSAFPLVWEAAGLTPSQVIDRLVATARRYGQE